MKLVVEDYWLNFHQKYSQDLETGVKALEWAFEGLGDLVRPDQREKIEGVLAGIRDARPAGAAVALERMRTLRATLLAWMEEELSAVERSRKLVSWASPDGERVLGLEFGPRLDAIGELLEKIRASRPTFEDLTGFIETARNVMPSIRAEEKKDEVKLVIVAQYPLARKLIDILAQGEKTLPLSRLPFQREAALTFVRLYTSGNKNARFYPENDSLVIEDAKVR